MNLIKHIIIAAICTSLFAVGCSSPSGQNPGEDVDIVDTDYFLSILSVGAGDSKTPLPFTSIRITSAALDSALHLKSDIEGNAFFSADTGKTYNIEVYHREHLFSKHVITVTKVDTATLESVRSNNVRMVRVRELFPSGRTRLLPNAHLLVEMDGIVRDSIAFDTDQKSITITHNSDYTVRVRHADFAESVITINPQETTTLTALLTRLFDSYKLYAHQTFVPNQSKAIPGVRFEIPEINTVLYSDENGEATYQVPVGTPLNTGSSIQASIAGYEFITMISNVTSTEFRFYFEPVSRPLVDLFEYEVGTEWRLVHRYNSSQTFYRHTVLTKTPENGGYRYSVRVEQLDLVSIIGGDTTFTMASESIREIVEDKFGYWNLVPLDDALPMPPFTGTSSTFYLNGTYASSLGMLRRRLPPGIQEYDVNRPNPYGGIYYIITFVINETGYVSYDQTNGGGNSGTTTYQWRRF
jgi:hypothetical protein